MDFDPLPNFLVCSRCGWRRPLVELCRVLLEEIYKTCNQCSAKAAARRKRKKQTAEADLALGGQSASNLRSAQSRIEQQQAVDQLLQLWREYTDRKLHQQAQEYRGNQYQQQGQHQQQQLQQDQQVWLDSITDNPTGYEASPLQLDEQSQRLIHQAEHSVNVDTLHANAMFDELAFHQDPQPEVSLEAFQTTSPWGQGGPSDNGMLSSPGGVGNNFSSSIDAAADAEQFGPELAPTGAQLTEPDFDFWFANEFGGFDTPEPHEAVIFDGNAGLGLGYLHNRADSMLPHPPGGADMPSQPWLETANIPSEADLQAFQAFSAHLAETRGNAVPFAMTEPDIMDVDMVDVNPSVLQQEYIGPFYQTPEKPARKPPKNLPTVDIDAYLADYALEDIWHQPTSPKHNLQGEALAKHLVREIGLAGHLLHLREFLFKTRNTDYITFFGTIMRLAEEEDCDLITPWGPLSDWLIVSVTEYDDLRDRYGVVDVKTVNKLEWKTRNKFKAERLALIKQLKDDLAKELVC